MEDVEPSRLDKLMNLLGEQIKQNQLILEQNQLILERNQLIFEQNTLILRSLQRKHNLSHVQVQNMAISSNH